MGGATHGHLQQLASAVMFTGYGGSVVNHADVMSVIGNGNSRQIVRAMERVDLSLTDGANLARELVAAALLAAKTDTQGLGSDQWARGLLGAALFQYREIDSCLEVEGADFVLRWLDLYTQMLDLLAAWNLCCEMDQKNTVKRLSYGEAKEWDGEIEGQMSTYQQRFMSCLPRWSSSAYQISADCEHDLVFASFITLALMTKLRYRLLRGLDAGTGMAAAAGAVATGALASTDGSLLNLRNVSLPEAAFLRIVGQAGQGSPFNRIHLRLAWARIGCSPGESQSIGRTIDNLHAYHDHLMIEADRCFSQLGADPRAGRGSKPGRGSEEEKGMGSSTDANGLVPAPLLAWIHYADAQALRCFRDGLSKSSSISVHAILPELIAAITRRFITIAQQQEIAEDDQSRAEAVADILSSLRAWVALGQQSGPHGNAALTVLDYFQEAHDDASYAAAWSTMRRCQPDRELETHFQRWMRQLWAQKQYDRVVALHRTAVRLLSEEHPGDGHYASNLTQICLQLHTQNPAGGAYTQRMLHNLLRVGIEPRRQVWRQWMRVKLMASEFQNARQACIYLAARLNKIGADKRVLLEDILFDISRAVSIGLKEADTERVYMLREAGTAIPLAAAGRVISLHEQLATHVCETPRPNRLKVAAAVHMHLLHCIRVKELAPTLAAHISRLEETITAVFWQAGRDEQLRLLCRQRYNRAWPPIWRQLPLVKSQNLVRAWLASSLAEKQLTGFDLSGGSQGQSADIGAQLTISTAPDGVLPPEGLRLPPAYADVTHHLSAEDTIVSLSLMYRVPVSVLRQHNRLATDGLVAGRKTVAIPRSHYSGQALSREPDAEEEERKKTLRRWMVATKCAEYEVGVVYLRANGYSLDRAVDAYRGDEQWERENPIKAGRGRIRR
ncbi:hypothetical protein DV738_g3917, partial [Chaetothyriales sp. CBS 135597]